MYSQRKYNLFFPLLLVLVSTNLLANSTSPLDSIKQVLRELNIPYDLQAVWTAALENLEDQQDSPEFRLLLAEVDTKIKAYQANGSSDAPKRPKLLQKVADKVNQGVKSAEIIGILQLANAAENNKNYNKAIQHYEKVVGIFEEQEQWERWVEYQEKIADLKAVYLKDYQGALAILPKIKAKMRDLGDGEGMQKVDRKIKNLQKNLDIKVVKEAPTVTLPSSSTTTPVTPPSPPVIAVPDLTAVIKEREQQLAKQQAAIKERQAEMTAANLALEKAQKDKDTGAIAALQKKLRAIENLRKKDIAAAGELEKDLMQQQLLLAQKQAELTKKNNDTLKLYGGLAALGLLFISTFFMYRSKRKDHAKLAVAYDELAEAQEELKEAEQKIKTLLDQQVSGAVAAELLAENPTGTPKKERRFVCIMFLDIRDFTPFVESKTPEEIIEYQNNVLGFMMEKVTEHGGIVNSVLGDGFMATFGAPVSAGNDCLQAYKAAVEILQMVKKKSQAREIPPTKIGIGMHAGNVVAGNVGTKTRKQYLISGNTVIIAARLEQLNKEYGSSLIISREVVERLPNSMNLPQVFDQVWVKGRSRPVEIAKYG